MYAAIGIILICIVGALSLAQVYSRRYRLQRPPIGVINLWDVALMLVGIVLVPYLYLALPLWLVVALIALAFMSVLSFTLEPILNARWRVWLVTLALLGADVGSAMQFGTTSVVFFAVNNVVLIVVVVGIANLWVQGGMKARDVAVLAGALAIYDFIFTAQLSLMTDLFTRLSGLPFAPLLAWPADNAQWFALGLGDLLLATLFPLLMRKAFGRVAAMSALAIDIVALSGVLLLPVLGLLQATFPVMVVLGPLMVAQYLYWIRQRQTERTTWQYRHEDLKGLGGL